MKHLRTSERGKESANAGSQLTSPAQGASDRLIRGRLRRVAVMSSLALLGPMAVVTLAPRGAVSLAAASSPASSGPGTYTVIGTGSDGLNERSSPSTSGTIVGNLPNASTIDIACQTSGGTYATGGSPATDSIWDQLTSGSYVADFWVNTPAVGTFSPGIPRCVPGPSVPPPPDLPVVPQPSSAGAQGLTVGDNPFPSGQCTFGADELVHDMMVNDPGNYPAGHDYIDIWGNADQWASSAASNGWTVTNTPRLDSVVVFQPGVQGAESLGHVALVTAVYGNGTFQIHEMNGPAGVGAYDFRTVSDQAGESFILIPPFS